MTSKTLILKRILEVYKDPLVDLMNDNKEQRKIWLTELLRRMKSWAIKLEPEVTGVKAFMFDVMKHINLEKEVELSEISKYCQDNEISLTHLDKWLVTWWINWVDNKIEIPNHLTYLPNPFEPFEMLLEFGGGYINRDGSGAFSAFNTAINPSSLTDTDQLA